MIKYRDGSWQIHLRDGWVKCAEADAYKISAIFGIALGVIDGKFEGEDVAMQLDDGAALCDKLGGHKDANWLRESAKVARHQPSSFDGLIFD